VALQMTTALRPIIGKSDHFLPSAADKQFFCHALDELPWPGAGNERSRRIAREMNGFNSICHAKLITFCENICLGPIIIE
jgi:hypothetical protein